MITTEQSNAIVDSLHTLLASADDASDLYGLMIGINSVIAQRAAEIRNETPSMTEAHGFAVQAHKDATYASDNAERMHDWFINIAQ